jgi:ADP-ribose pyrophosphatase YjhB (NUDIX family)
VPHLFQVAVKGILTKRKQALILRGAIRRGPQKGRLVWDAPGGRVEKSESLIDALDREIQEELPGITELTILEPIYATRCIHLEDQADLITIYYRVSARVARVKLSTEHEHYRWVTRGDLRQLADNKEEQFFDGLVEALEITL